MQKYKTDLQQIMNGYGEKLAKLNARKEQSGAMYKGDMLKNALHPIEKEREQLQAQTLEQIKQLSQAARDRISTAEINAGEVNAADLALLDPQRIKLTQAEFDALAGRYAGNFTMNAALRTYAKSCGLDYSGELPKADALRMIDNLSRSAEMAAHNGQGGYNVEAAASLGGAVVI